MKDSTRSSFVLIGAGLIMIAFGIIILFITIIQWDAGIANLKPTGMAIIIGVSIALIAIGLFLIIKFII
ncbi:MAG: hypothetical protein ACFFAI_11910 [Promethearchaeota archaeon]